MKKDRAIELLGGTPKRAAEAMGYRAVQTIYLWPDDLPQATADRVMGVVGRIAGSATAQDAGPAGDTALTAVQEVTHD